LAKADVKSSVSIITFDVTNVARNHKEG
jgi:hypothetical protein